MQAEEEKRFIFPIDNFLAKEQRQIFVEEGTAGGEIERCQERLPHVSGGGQRSPKQILPCRSAASHDQHGEQRFRKSCRILDSDGQDGIADLFRDAELLRNNKRPSEAVNERVQFTVHLLVLSGAEAAHPVRIRTV